MKNEVGRINKYCLEVGWPEYGPHNVHYEIGISDIGVEGEIASVCELVRSEILLHSRENCNKSLIECNVVWQSRNCSAITSGQRVGVSTPRNIRIELSHCVAKVYCIQCVIKVHLFRRSCHCVPTWIHLDLKYEGKSLCIKDPFGTLQYHGMRTSS